MKKTSYPYVIFVGEEGNTYPEAVAPTKEKAIERAQYYPDAFVEVVYMPEEDDNINEVVYTKKNGAIKK